MPNLKTCEKCKGIGGYDALINIHDDKTEWTKCDKCNGKGHCYEMTDNEETDYHADY